MRRDPLAFPSGLLREKACALELPCYALPSLANPFPDPGVGGKGRTGGPPSPNGKKGVSRTSSLDHSRPKRAELRCASFSGEQQTGWGGDQFRGDPGHSQANGGRMVRNTMGANGSRRRRVRGGPFETPTVASDELGVAQNPKLCHAVRGPATPC